MTLTKKEAIQKMVNELSSISQEHLRIISEHNGEYHSFPMWGTMWRLDYFGNTLWEKSRIMVESKEEIYRDDFIDDKEREEFQARLDDPNDYMEEYIDEEMQGERCILDKNGEHTALFIYDIDGEYYIGINGAGWDFYDGVWDRLYDAMGLNWHTD